MTVYTTTEVCPTCSEFTLRVTWVELEFDAWSAGAPTRVDFFCANELCAEHTLYLAQAFASTRVDARQRASRHGTLGRPAR